MQVSATTEAIDIAFPDIFARIDFSTVAQGEAATAASPPGASFLALAVTLMLMQTIALAYPIVRSRWYGWKLALGLSLLYFGTVTFMSQIESLVYLEGKMPEGMLGGLFAMGAVVAIVFAPIAVLVLGKWKPPQSEAETERRYEPPCAPSSFWRSTISSVISSPGRYPSSASITAAPTPGAFSRR